MAENTTNLTNLELEGDLTVGDDVTITDDINAKDIYMTGAFTSGIAATFALGTQANTAGSGCTLSNAKTTIHQVLADDGGVAITAGNAKPAKSRFLVTANPGDATLDGYLGQIKFATNITASADYQAGVRGYVELVGGNTVNTGGANANIGAGVHALRGYITLDANTTIASGHYVCGVGAHLSVKAGATFTTTGRLAAFACFADDQAGGATATQKWQYGFYVPYGTATEAIRVGESASAVGSGLPMSATTTALVRFYGDDGGAAISSATFARVGVFRHLLTYTAGNREQEAAGVVGQLVSVAGTNRHNMCAVMGSYEGSGALTIDGQAATTDPWIQAGVIGRIGVGNGTTTLNANGVLTAVAAMSNTTAFAANSGIYAGFYAGKWTGTLNFDYGLFVDPDSVTRGIGVGTLGSNITSGVPILNATAINGFYSDDNGADMTPAGVRCNLRARTYFSVNQTVAQADYYALRGHVKIASGVNMNGDQAVVAANNSYLELAGATTRAANGFLASHFAEIWTDGNLIATGSGAKIAGVMSRFYNSAGTPQGTVAAFMATKQFASVSNWPYGLYIDSATIDIRLGGGPCIRSGTGDPNGGSSSPIGSLYLRSDNGGNRDTSLYINTDGGTTWAACICAS